MTQPAASSSALPLTVDALTTELVLLYAQAEQRILVRFAHLVEVTPAAQLLGALRREAQIIVADIRARSWPLAQQVTALATQRGDEAALRELRRVMKTSERLSNLLVNEPSIALGPGAANDLGTRLTATLPRILRFADDAYRAAAIDEAVTGIVHDKLTHPAAQHTAWRKLTERGITGFTDRAGRQWNLSSYVEMATRTGVQHAFNAGHLARMVRAGVEQFTVPSDGHPCPLCKPWQGRVLTVSGPSPTIEEARIAGLWHPSCKHTLVAYFPGISKFAPPSPWTAADQAAYDATQRLRALERDVRAHKRVAAAALTPLDRKRAERRARASQALIRLHAQRHGLNRRARREQRDLGNS